MIFPPSSFEKVDYFPCELCGQDRNVDDLIEIKGHSVCPECAHLIQNDEINLPSKLFLKRPSSRAILIQLRDLLILIGFISIILFLVMRFPKKEMEQRSKTLEMLLKEEKRELHSK